MYFKQIFDNKLAQYSYLVGCQANGTALIIDPMRDIDTYIREAEQENLTIVAAADTHIHADYLSGLREFAERGVKVYASDEGGPDWKYEWLINSKYDYLTLKDGDKFEIGNIKFKVWHTPGHTPEHLSYFITDGAASEEPIGIVTGDFVFVGDVGRPDLLESAAGQAGIMVPSARTLFHSVENFRQLPEYLQVWPGHGAGSACGKALGAIPESTVGYELRTNPSIKASESEDNFVKFILDGQPEPPLYFARMKRENKRGPKLLDGIPQPERLTPEELTDISGNTDVVLLDTRSRQEYSGGHLPGSLLSPLNKQFNTVAGSYITENETIYLIVEENRLKEAITDLIRIGLDHIAGFITPVDLQKYGDQGGALEQLKVADFETVEAYQNDEKYAVLDVRKSSEFEQGHLPKALNIAHTRLAENLHKLPGDKTWLVHCQTGARSAVAAAFLKRHGYRLIQIDDEFNPRSQDNITTPSSATV
ncbi:MAG: rhodanese-like domain-containing protein [Balneolaceae bacterium]